MNDVKMLGRLTKEPKSLTMQNQTELCVFDLAVDRRYKTADGQKGCDFFTCKAFGTLATFCAQNLIKGERIAISGRLANEPWTDTHGQKRISTVIVLREVYFADGRKSSAKAEPTDYPDPTDDNAPLPDFE